MADEVQTPQAPAAEAPGPESPDFDWGAFFLETPGTPPPAVATETPEPLASEPSPPAPSDEEDPDIASLKKQVEQLTQTVQKTSQTTEEIAQRDKVKAAVEAWKGQASPAEQAMAPLLEQATSLEDIKIREGVIKQAVGMLDQSRTQIEQDVQRKFGLPVQPTFSPIPEKERIDKMLEEGNIDEAANAILKGVFNT